MTQISGIEKGLVFEIVSARICDQEEKKHVVYILQVRHLSGYEDLSPSVIERRYTHFLSLYNDLKKEHPQMMMNVTFPRKVLMGNFDNELISSRSTEFELLLKYISSETILRTSNSLIRFLQDCELQQAKKFLEQNNFTYALPILENIFRLLNKVLTDRNPAVIISLCRLLWCNEAAKCKPGLQKWGSLAVHRFEGVSDSDLLELYTPLLHVCVGGWGTGEEKRALEKRLGELCKTRGSAVDRDKNLGEAVERVHEKLFGRRD